LVIIINVLLFLFIVIILRKVQSDIDIVYKKIADIKSSNGIK
jgi:hypothetical protein